MILLDVLAGSPPLFITVAVLLGLLVGSFLNVVIYRLPVMMEQAEREYCSILLEQPVNTQPPFNLWTPRSRCSECGHMISAFENIPIISYIFQGGRCKHCKTRISIQYPIVEIVSGALAGIVAWYFGFGWQAGAALLLTWALVALSVIDLHHRLLPDSITLPFLWLGLTAALFSLFTDLQSSVIGAVAGYMSLWSVYQLFRLLTGKEGMGYGDFKLLAMLGAWQGWQFLPAIIILSSLVGSIIGITLMIGFGRDRSVPIPFGPFLATAGWLTLLWGSDLNKLYNAWFNL
jgi:leader peptidase (prepilin peptidase)/N-methyltransferase